MSAHRAAANEDSQEVSTVRFNVTSGREPPVDVFENIFGKRRRASSRYSHGSGTAQGSHGVFTAAAEG